jgi:acyl carrier protein
MGSLPNKNLNLEKWMSDFYQGLAEILEINPDDVKPELELPEWDSLAVVSTIALADECFDVMLNGQAISACTSVSDIEKLIALKQK